MPAEIVIKINWRKEWQEADGSTCEHCGDVAWLKQVKLTALMQIRGDQEAIAELNLCQSCGEGFEP